MKISSKFGTSATVFGLLALPVVSLFGSSLTASAKDIEVTNSKALAEVLKTVAKGDVLNLSTKEGKDWAGSTGLTITLPEGVTLNGNGVTLHAPIKVTGDNVKISNVKLQGSQAANVPGVSIHSGADNVTVDGSTITNYFRGVSTVDNGNNTGIHVTGNTFSSNSDNDVLIWASAGNDYVVSDNTSTKPLQVRGNTADKKLTGVRIQNNKSTIEKNVTAIMSVYTDGALITGNTVDGTKATGALVSLSGADNLQFNGNTLTGGAYGVSATLTYRGKFNSSNPQVTDYAPVKNITFADNAITGSTKAGVRLNVFDGAKFAAGNEIESKGNAIQLASQSFKADNANKGSLVIEKGNTLTGAKAIAADADAKFDATAKLDINKAAVLNGKTGNEADLTKQLDIPEVAGLKVSFTTTPESDNNQEVTKPSNDKKNVAAPNTGAANVIATVLGASTVAALALAGAVVAGKFAKTNR